MMALFLTMLPWIVVLFCIASQAFFAAAELSIISANRIRLEASLREGSTSAERVLWFRDNPDQLFGTTLLGTNLSMVAGSTVASLTLLQIDPNNGDWLTMLIISPLVLIGGEIVPKSVAQARATSLSQFLSRPLKWVHTLFGPFIIFIGSYTRFLYGILGINTDTPTVMASREELVMLMENPKSTESEIVPEEKEMISRIFSFSELKARDSMIPLAEMVAVPADATVSDAAAAIARAGFSRLPVYSDRIDNVMGILHHLDLLSADDPGEKVARIARPVYFAPANQDIDELLFILQREAASAAIVVDEFGGAVGLVTLEDILEEIVGEIHDEFDRESGMWRAVPDGFIVSARATIEHMNTAFDLDLEDSPNYETLGGYALEVLKHIPRVGEWVPLPNGGRLTVRRATPRSIEEFHLSPPEDAE